MNTNSPVVSSVIKNYSCAQNAFLSRTVTIPLVQEYGTSYRVLVRPGDVVSEGDKIAVSETRSLSPSYIHSSVPGKVIDITPCILQNGRQDFAVRIQFGGSFSFLGKKLKRIDSASLTPSGITETILNSGVINTFKTRIPESLGQQIKKIKNCECVAVRLFDEDPYRITDSLVAKFNLEHIVEASKVLAKAVGAKGVVLAIDQKMQNKAELKTKEDEAIHFLEMNIRRYPCGTPREMVSAFSRSGLKKSCPFTLSKNSLFTDASTMLEVYNAVILGSPAISRYVHFSGNCLHSSCLLNVKVGTPVKDIVAQLGGFAKTPALIIINGELGGSCVQSLEMPVTKDIKSIKFVSARKITDEHVYTCVNCGGCRNVCPVKISPDILYNSVVTSVHLPELLEKSAVICNSCGLCSTVCQARLPLSQTISVLKENILEKQNKQEKNEQ